MRQVHDLQLPCGGGEERGQHAWVESDMGGTGGEGDGIQRSEHAHIKQFHQRIAYGMSLSKKREKE
jgi:hypothetical protein